MNILDTSFISPTARFPIKKGTLDFIQNGTKELIAQIIIAQIGAAYSTSTAYVLYGCTSSISGPNTVIVEGAIFYNGELYYAPTATIPNPAGSNVIVVNWGGVSYTTNADPVTFTDSSVHNVHNQRRVNYASSGLTGTGNICDYSDLFFLYDNGVTYSISTLAAAGGVTGTLFIKKNIRNNTLSIKGALTANNAQNFSASPTATYSLMVTLPAIYTPVTNSYFSAYYYLSGLIKDDLGIAWIKQVNCAINTGGQLLINWIKPDVAVSGYGIDIDAIVNLF